MSRDKTFHKYFTQESANSMLETVKNNDEFIRSEEVSFSDRGTPIKMIHVYTSRETHGNPYGLEMIRSDNGNYFIIPIDEDLANEKTTNGWDVEREKKEMEKSAISLDSLEDIPLSTQVKKYTGEQYNYNYEWIKSIKDVGVNKDTFLKHIPSGQIFKIPPVKYEYVSGYPIVYDNLMQVIETSEGVLVAHVTNPTGDNARLVFTGNVPIDRGAVMDSFKRQRIPFKSNYQMPIYEDDGEIEEYKEGGRIKSAIMRDRKYVSDEPHEMAYHKKHPSKRNGYRNIKKYEDGGSINKSGISKEEYEELLESYDYHGAMLEDSEGEDRKKHLEKMKETERKIHSYERNYKMEKGGLFGDEIKEFDTEEEVAAFAEKKYGLTKEEADVFAFDYSNTYVFPATEKEIEDLWVLLNNRYAKGGSISSSKAAIEDKIRKLEAAGKFVTSKEMKDLNKKMIADAKAELSKLSSEVKAVEKPIKKEVAKVEKEVKKEVAKKPVKRKPSKNESVMQWASRTRKDGEGWKEAQARAKKEMADEKAKPKPTTKKKTIVRKKAAATKSTPKKKTIVRKKKATITKVDQTKRGIKSDAKRQALPAGRRISKDGNVYYEKRSNRADKSQPTKRTVTSKRRKKL